MGKKRRGKHFLFQRGNVGVARLLIATYEAGPKGIATYDMLHKIGSTHHGKGFIKRAEREGLIKRKLVNLRYMDNLRRSIISLHPRG